MASPGPGGCPRFSAVGDIVGWTQHRGPPAEHQPIVGKIEQRESNDMTAIVTPTETCAAFWSAADATGRHGAGPAVSYDRCVNWLLDLHQATTDPDLQRLVIDVLADLGELGPVSSDPELESLMLGALASVEVAFEVAGQA